MSEKELIWQKFSALGLAPEDARELANTASIQHYEPGELLYKDTSSCQGFFVIQSGELRAFALSESGKEITLFSLREGDECILCSLCVSPELGNRVSLQARTPLTLIIIPPKTFISVRERSAVLTNYALALISRRFSEAISVMTSALFSPLSARISEFLASRSDGGIVRVTHEEIASEIGSVREAVSRVLKEMERAGQIELGRGKIVLLS